MIQEFWGTFAEIYGKYLSFGPIQADRQAELATLQPIDSTAQEAGWMKLARGLEDTFKKALYEVAALPHRFLQSYIV